MAAVNSISVADLGGLVATFNPMVDAIEGVVMLAAMNEVMGSAAVGTLIEHVGRAFSVVTRRLWNQDYIDRVVRTVIDSFSMPLVYVEGAETTSSSYFGVSAMDLADIADIALVPTNMGAEVLGMSIDFASASLAWSNSIEPNSFVDQFMRNTRNARGMDKLWASMTTSYCRQANCRTEQHVEIAIREIQALPSKVAAFVTIAGAAIGTVIATGSMVVAGAAGSPVTVPTALTLIAGAELFARSAGDAPPNTMLMVPEAKAEAEANGAWSWVSNNVRLARWSSYGASKATNFFLQEDTIKNIRAAAKHVEVTENSFREWAMQNSTQMGHIVGLLDDAIKQAEAQQSSLSWFKPVSVPLPLSLVVREGRIVDALAPSSLPHGSALLLPGANGTYFEYPSTSIEQIDGSSPDGHLITSLEFSSQADIRDKLAYVGAMKYWQANTNNTNATQALDDHTPSTSTRVIETANNYTNTDFWLLSILSDVTLMCTKWTIDVAMDPTVWGWVGATGTVFHGLCAILKRFFTEKDGAYSRWWVLTWVLRKFFALDNLMILGVKKGATKTLQAAELSKQAATATLTKVHELSIAVHRILGYSEEHKQKLEEMHKDVTVHTEETKKEMQNLKGEVRKVTKRLIKKMKVDELEGGHARMQDIETHVVRLVAVYGAEKAHRMLCGALAAGLDPRAVAASVRITGLPAPTMVVLNGDVAIDPEMLATIAKTVTRTQLGLTEIDAQEDMEYAKSYLPDLYAMLHAAAEQRGKPNSFAVEATAVIVSCV